MLAFYFVFSAVRGIEGIDYIAFLLVGLVSWKWFASGLSQVSNAVQSNYGLINQIYLPKDTFIYIPLFLNFIKFCIVFFVLLVFLLITEHSISFAWFGLPVIIFAQFMLILGVGSLLASVLPLFPDIKILIENALLMLFFMSGIFFNINEVGGTRGEILRLNPVGILLDDYRSVLLHGKLPGFDVLAITTLISLALYLLSLVILKRFDKVYPKIILR
jgi:lipopolysaccharide transport system permease protein